MITRGLTSGYVDSIREVLEAALIVGIVMAASRGAAQRGLWVGGGIVVGVLGALGVAAAAGTIGAMAESMGQELFEAAILFAAALMLGWHNVWMARHGRDLAANATRLGHDVCSGAQPLWALAFAVGLAVLREGSETYRAFRVIIEVGMCRETNHPFKSFFFPIRLEQVAQLPREGAGCAWAP